MTFRQLLKCLLVVAPILLARSTCALESFIDRIKLDTFKIKLGDGVLKLYLDAPGYASLHDEDDLTEITQPPIELGAHLMSDGIDLNSAKILGRNKIGFGEHTTLKIKNTEEEERCVEVEWKTSNPQQTLEDCFLMKPHNWYGGPEQSDQYWPIEQHTFEDYSYVTKEVDSMAIAEPFWLNSAGFYIYVDKTVPLFIDQNNHRQDTLCMIAKHAAPYPPRRGGPILKYTMCKFANPREAQEHAVKHFLGKPSSMPDTKMVQHPIWSTWATYRSDINEGVIMQLAKDITNNGFKNSQLEIDDGWETCYGDLQFNKTRFPNIKKLTSQLKKMGFRTTMWVHPFVNLDCNAHAEGLRKGYFTKNLEGQTTTVWWNGIGSSIDTRNPAAAEWYEKRLRDILAASGVDSLKFDAGETSFHPQVPAVTGPELEQPVLLTQSFVELAAKFAPMVEVRSAKHTQHLPIFVRMMDRCSLWGIKHSGIHTVLTTTFMMNLNGYPFVLPDMVGGNAYDGVVVTKEIFLRWLQVTVFLPSIQFSIPPWVYDKETVELTKKYLDLHLKYSDTIIALMKKAVETGQPINPPIWWVDPDNKVAHGINSEYMLGEDILVAPVLEEGANKRDIYLPKGQWRDEAKPDKPIVTGPAWLRDYPAPIQTLPWFTRVSSGAQQVSITILLIVLCFCLHNLFR